MPSRAWCSISSEEVRGDEALLLQRDAAPRVPRRGRRQVPVAPARVPESLLRPREGRGQLPALPTEYEFADQAGFAGLMINEHHSTPSCVNVGVNMTAAVLGRTTRRAKILLLGNILPIEDNPVRMAEQLAMADLISGGRVLSGFVRGVGVETWWSN